MDENISDISSLKKKNMRVMRSGAMIATIGVLLTACVGVSQGWVKTPLYPDIGDGVGEFIGFIITILFRVGPVVFIQVLLIFIFDILSERGKEISDLMIWLFYAFELAIGLTPLILFRQYEWW